MASTQFTKRSGIRSISGKIGNFIFYTRNGKQFVRRANKHIETSSREYREIIERLTRVKP